MIKLYRGIRDQTSNDRRRLFICFDDEFDELMDLNGIGWVERCCLYLVLPLVHQRISE